MQIALPNVDRRLPIVDGLNRTNGWPSAHELEQTPGDGEGPGSLVCCLSCVAKRQTQLSDWPTQSKREFFLPEGLQTGILIFSYLQSPDETLVPLSLTHPADLGTYSFHKHVSQFLIINLFENTQTHPIDSVCLENPDSYSEGPREVKSTEADSGWRAGRGETACIEWIVAVLMDCCLVIQLCPTLYDLYDLWPVAY